jgi:hypothetical protein
MAELLQLPVVRLHAADLPNPMVLDPLSECAPPDESDGAATDSEQLVADRCGLALAPTPCSAVPGGTKCWAQHGSDGLWYRAVVQTQVDPDCYFVQVAK